MKSCILTVVAGLFLGQLCVPYAYDGTRVNAKAVSVQWRFATWEYDDGRSCEFVQNYVPDGSIIVYTIREGRVTQKDTVYRREQGLAQYAIFDLTGTRIVFFRKGRAPGSAGTCVTVNGGKHCVSIINTNGTGLRDLCELPFEPDRNQALDWPAGEWVYYVRSVADIWKVNVETGATQRVCDQTPGGDYGIRRFSLDLSATHTAVEGGGFHNALATFSSGGCGTIICDRPGCNIAVSPSGAMVGSYGGGAHEDLFVNGTDPSRPAPDGFSVRCGEQIAVPSLAQVKNWNGGVSVGVGSELIGWAVNSDKWVLQEVGWCGHADQLAYGSNQVVLNWVDQAAINISQNPPPQRTSTGGPIGVAWNNSTGDLWIEDPVNNPNGNKYEDIRGIWHAVAGATSIVPEGQKPRKRMSPSIFNQDDFLKSSDHMIIDLHGRGILKSHLSKGVYIIAPKSRSMGMPPQRRLIAR